MKKEILFRMKSPYRDDFRILGYRFGEGEKSIAIVGSMRGDEIQQQYICSRIVNKLMRLEENGCINNGHSILVIPSCNPFSLNVSRRFWTMDNTDINRMFPGYALGETTQRIAAAIFKQLEGFRYGIQMASFYVPGDFVPHVRMLRTGYEDTETAKLFGLPFVTVRKPLPFDTTLLNYNWQIWNTKAYSIYSGQTSNMDHATSYQTIDAILRFMGKTGIIRQKMQDAGYASEIINEEELINIKAGRAGILYRKKGPGAHVEAGETIARIYDPYNGSVLEEVASPVQGTIFFSNNKPLALQNAILFRIRSFE